MTARSRKKDTNTAAATATTTTTTSSPASSPTRATSSRRAASSRAPTITENAPEKEQDEQVKEEKDQERETTNNTTADIENHQDHDMKVEDNDHEEEIKHEENGTHDEIAPENTLKILIATDNHLGYMEKDPIRGDDSFKAFEEILQIANEHDVDFVLLGGDLFHDNKPSRKSLHTTMELMRTYCMGDRPCHVEFLSDQSVNFPNKFATVNFQDPNINVSMPIFSIHGNHDDPSGDGNLAALDLLSVAGFVNYFGQCKTVDDISISPLLLRKGNTKLSLYGLGNVRDERLHRTFLRKKVKMLRPSVSENEWFNLFVLHQNRVQHGPKNFIPESFIEDFFHLVLWGHEHECLIDPQFNPEQEFYITQPGSSVATSLCEGESRQKHVAILSIHERDFHLSKIRLKSVRPFVMDDIVLKDVPGLSPADKSAVSEFVENKVYELIDRAMKEWKTLNGITEDESEDNVEDDDEVLPQAINLDTEEDEDEDDNNYDAEFDVARLQTKLKSKGKGKLLAATKTKHKPGIKTASSNKSRSKQRQSKYPLPLIRLKVEYSGGFQAVNPQRFGQRFVQKVANPKEILHYYRKRTAHIPEGGKKKGLKGFDEDLNAIDLEAMLPGKLDTFRVEDLVAEYLNAQNLEVLPEEGLGEAVKDFVEKDDREAIKEFVSDALQKTQDMFNKDRRVADEAMELDMDMATQASSRAKVSKKTVSDTDLLRKQITQHKQILAEQYEKERAERERSGLMMSKKRKAVKRRSDDGDDDDEEVYDDDDDNFSISSASVSTSKRSKASTVSTGRKGTTAAASKRTGRGASKTARGGGRGASSTASKRKRARDEESEEEEEEEDDDVSVDDDVIDDDDVEEEAPSKKRKFLPTVGKTATKTKSCTSAAAKPAAKTTKKTAASSSAANLRQPTLNFFSQRSQSKPTETIVLDDEEEEAESFASASASLGKQIRSRKLPF